MRPFCHLVIKGVRVDSPPCSHSRQELVKALTEYRLRSSLGQADLAAGLGISLRTFQNWERGHTDPTRKHWKAISSVLNGNRSLR
jgi:DNA-binding transcriptional regulator YiaG